MFISFVKTEKTICKFSRNLLRCEEIRRLQKNYMRIAMQCYPSLSCVMDLGICLFAVHLSICITFLWFLNDFLLSFLVMQQIANIACWNSSRIFNFWIIFKKVFQDSIFSKSSNLHYYKCLEPKYVNISL